MPRKKRTRLPNGFGTIRYLGKGRRNPYAVHPPAIAQPDGSYLIPKALCYVSDYYVGVAVLNAYRAGTYRPGDELQFETMKTAQDHVYDDLIRRMVDDHQKIMEAKGTRVKSIQTFRDVYDMMMDWKFGDKAKKQYSESTTYMYKLMGERIDSIADKPFSDVVFKDVQDLCDGISEDYGVTSAGNAKTVLQQIYKYATAYELTDKNFISQIQIAEHETKSAEPFTEDEMKILYDHKDNDICAMLLIMCYSGFRVSAYKSLTIDTDKMFFQGGIKVPETKDRIVPIHSGIVQYLDVLYRLRKDPTLQVRNELYNKMKLLLPRIGITEPRSPHSARDTFSVMCERYNVKENDRKRMLGHVFDDTTNKYYSKRTLEELREEIEKIPAPDVLFG